MAGRHGKMSGSPFHIEYLYKNNHNEYFNQKISCQYLKGFICTFNLNDCYRKRCLPFKCKYLRLELRRKNKCNECVYYKSKKTCLLLKLKDVSLNFAEYCDRFLSKDSNKESCKIIDNSLKHIESKERYAELYEKYRKKRKSISSFYKILSECNNENIIYYALKISKELKILDSTKKQLLKSPFYQEGIFLNDEKFEKMRTEIEEILKSNK